MSPHYQKQVALRISWPRGAAWSRPPQQFDRETHAGGAARSAARKEAVHDLEEGKMVTRRSFLAYTGGTALTLFAYDKFGIRQALAAIPGGTLDPGGVPKFVTPLLIPPVMPKAGTIVQRGGKSIDYYEISMKQFKQQILPAGLPKTTV
jgi:hypothetical protein